MDLAHGEFQVVRELKRHKGFRPLSPKDLLNRPDRRKRIHELERQRMDILPSIRLLLDHVSSAEAGVSPLNKLSRIRELASLISKYDPFLPAVQYSADVELRTLSC